MKLKFVILILEEFHLLSFGFLTLILKCKPIVADRVEELFQNLLHENDTIEEEVRGRRMIEKVTICYALRLSL